jgi:hypothetical protein
MRWLLIPFLLGYILLDNLDIQDIQLQCLRKHIAFVSQDAVSTCSPYIIRILCIMLIADFFLVQKKREYLFSISGLVLDHKLYLGTLKLFILVCCSLVLLVFEMISCLPSIYMSK